MSREEEEGGMKRPDLERLEVDALTDPAEYDEGGVAAEPVLELIAYTRHLEERLGIDTDNTYPAVLFVGGHADGVVSHFPWHARARYRGSSYMRVTFALVDKGPGERPAPNETTSCMIATVYDKEARRVVPLSSEVSDVEHILATVAALASIGASIGWRMSTPPDLRGHSTT